LKGLTELRLEYCRGMTVDVLEQFLSTAVQGCLLTVRVTHRKYPSDVVREQSKAARARVLASRTSRNTPALKFY
jgi:hypothetical protein